MKTVRLSAIALVMSLSMNLFAQTTTAPAQTTPAAKSAKQQGKEEKQQWLDEYNKWKPKLEELNSKLASQDKNGEFAQNVNKLNTMTTDFRNKIDQYDAASPDNKKKMEAEMKKEKDNIEALYKTAKGQYNDIKAKQSKTNSDQPKSK